MKKPNSKKYRAYIDAVVDRINISGWDGPVDQDYFYDYFVKGLDPNRAADDYVSDREDSSQG